MLYFMPVASVHYSKRINTLYISCLEYILLKYEHSQSYSGICAYIQNLNVGHFVLKRVMYEEQITVKLVGVRVYLGQKNCI